MTNTLAPVCVVDDDASIRAAVRGLLRSAGWKARTFKSARDFLARPRPAASCLVLDVQMPGLSGLDLQLLLAKEQPQVPIIFLTGHGDIPTSVRAIKTGAVEFLTKPFDDEQLLTAIRQAIAQSPTALAEVRGRVSGPSGATAKLSPPALTLESEVRPLGINSSQQGIAAGVCATCGKSITHPGPDGECVRCLVSFGFLAEDQEAERAKRGQSSQTRSIALCALRSRSKCRRLPCHTRLWGNGYHVSCPRYRFEFSGRTQSHQSKVGGRSHCACAISARSARGRADSASERCASHSLR